MIRANDKPELGQYLSDYSVTFCCENMNVIVGVYVSGNDGDSESDDEIVAVELADKTISDYYGFSPMSFCQETIVEYCGAVV